MDFEKPSFAFVLFDGRLAPILFRSFYREYAQSIPLLGSETVLDLGCGAGGIARWLAPRLQPSGSLVCLDPCPPLIRIAAHRVRGFPNVRCLVGTIRTVDLRDAAFDRIVIHNALHDIPSGERIETVVALERVLRPGGTIHLREPTKPSHGIAPAAVRSLMEQAGLRGMRSRQYSRFPIGSVVDAVFEKPKR